MRAGRSRLGPQVRQPAADRLQVLVPAPTFDDYLRLACAQIRRCGLSEPTLGLAPIRLLHAVANASSRPDRRAAMGHQLALVKGDAGRQVKQRGDLVEVRAAADALLSVLDAAPTG